MKKMCVDLDIHIRATEYVSDELDSGTFEIPVGVLEEMRKEVADIITSGDPKVDCGVDYKVYRSEVMEFKS